MAVKKKAPERRYSLWYQGLQLFCMAVILAPCILITVSEGDNQNLSLFLYAQAAAFAILLFLDGAKSRFGRVGADGRCGDGKGMILFLGAAVTGLMWAAVVYMMR